MNRPRPFAMRTGSSSDESLGGPEVIDADGSLVARFSMDAEEAARLLVAASEKPDAPA